MFQQLINSCNEVESWPGRRDLVAILGSLAEIFLLAIEDTLTECGDNSGDCGDFTGDCGSFMEKI